MWPPNCCAQIGGAGNSEMIAVTERRRLLEAGRLAGLTEEDTAKLASLAAVRSRDPGDDDDDDGAEGFGRADWTAVVDNYKYGIGVVRADMSTLSFEYVRTATGDVFDSVKLSKK